MRQHEKKSKKGLYYQNGKDEIEIGITNGKWK